MKIRTINDIINHFDEYYISKGFTYSVECDKITIHKYYDGYMDISISNAEDNDSVIFIIGIDYDIDVIKFVFNLWGYNPITGLMSLTDDEFKKDLIDTIEYNIFKKDKIKSYYKRILRSEKLNLLGV